MKGKKNACVLAACAALTLWLGGCAAGEPETTAPPTEQPAAAASPQATQQAVVLPTGEKTPAPTQEPRANLSVTVDGTALKGKAMIESDETFLPLVQTAEALGYKASVSELEEDAQRRRVHTFSVGEDKSQEVGVSYLLKDNTVSDISFARDKMIVPVDRVLQFEGDVVYAPADFFEEAMGAEIETDAEQKKVTVRSAKARHATPAPEETAAAAP